MHTIRLEAREPGPGWNTILTPTYKTKRNSLHVNFGQKSNVTPRLSEAQKIYKEIGTRQRLNMLYQVTKDYTAKAGQMKNQIKKLRIKLRSRSPPTRL